MTYHVRDGILLRNVCDVWLLIAYGEAADHCLYVREVNDSLAWYWERFAREEPLEAIVNEAAEVFDAPEGLIKRDVLSLFKDLCRMGYLIPKAEDSPRAGAQDD